MGDAKSAHFGINGIQMSLFIRIQFWRLTTDRSGVAFPHPGSIECQNPQYCLNRFHAGNPYERSRDPRN
jgi:hypothetical protein